MNWIPFLFQASLLLFLFYGAYFLLLRQETHHQINRAILLCMIVLSVALPFLPLPEQVVAPIKHDIIPPQSSEVLQRQANLEFLDFETNIVETPQEIVHVNWLQLLVYAYWTGFLLMAFRFLFQLGSLLLLLSQSRISHYRGVLLVESDKEFQPFSFFNMIFISREKNFESAAAEILQHEMIHAQQWHSVDIILSELFSIFFWFHPFIGLLKRSIRLNLEFIVDEKMLRTGIDKKHYQYSLLKVSTGNRNWHLSNNFNQSFIKKRIIMMNLKKSPSSTKLKYLVFLPLFVLSYSFINLVQAQTNVDEVQKAYQKAEEMRREAAKKAEKAEEAYQKAMELLEEAEKASRRDELSEEEQRKLEEMRIEMGEMQIEMAEKMERLRESQELEMERAAAEMERAVEEMEAFEEKRARLEEASEMMEKEGRALEQEMQYIEEQELAIELQMKELEAQQEALKAHEEHLLADRDLESRDLEKDNIYAVIRSNLSRGDLESFRENVRAYGIQVEYPELEFNSAGAISRIKMTFRADSGAHGVAFSYNNGGPIEKPIVFYRIAGNPHQFGIQAGMTSNIESSLRETMRNMTGFFFGNFN